MCESVGNNLKVFYHCKNEFVIKLICADSLGAHQFNLL